MKIHKSINRRGTFLVLFALAGAGHPTSPENPGRGRAGDRMEMGVGRGGGVHRSLYVVMSGGHQHWSAYAVISGTLVVIGALFGVGWKYRKA